MVSKDLLDRMKNYDPDIELKGSGNTDYGHYLADRFCKEIQKDLKKILNKYDPGDLFRDSRKRSKLKGILNNYYKNDPFTLSNPNFQSLSTAKMWNMYIQLRKSNFS